MEKGKPHHISWQDKPDAPFIEKISKIHPHQMILYTTLVGICLLFLGLEVVFLVNASISGTGDINVPVAFYLSTCVLLGSSFVIRNIHKAYLSGALPRLLQFLTLTLALGLIYCALQIIGWLELYTEAVYLQGTPAGAFLYVISGVHIIHILGGMLFLVTACRLVYPKMIDPVDSLIYETSPYEALRLKMLSNYWHVMDAIWLGLFISFLLVF